MNEAIEKLRKALLRVDYVQQCLVIAQKAAEGADVTSWNDDMAKSAQRNLLSAKDYLEQAIVRLEGWVLEGEDDENSDCD